jgi:hypothetical protein
MLTPHFQNCNSKSNKPHHLHAAQKAVFPCSIKVKGGFNTFEFVQFHQEKNVVKSSSNQFKT